MNENGSKNDIYGEEEVVFEVKRKGKNAYPNPNVPGLENPSRWFCSIYPQLEKDREVNFRCHNLDDEQIIELSQAMKFNTRVKYLVLYENDCSKKGCFAIADFIKENETLYSLDMSLNCIGPEGGVKLAEALKVNCALKEIYLYGNLIEDRGAIAFGEMLRYNRTLAWVSLSDCQIEDEGGKVIAEALKGNKTIKEMYLRYNQFGDETAIVLAEALKTNKILKELFIRYNMITDRGAEQIYQAILNTNKTLLGLDFEANNLSINMKEKFRELSEYRETFNLQI